MAALDEDARPRSHVAVRLRPQPVAEDAARRAAPHAENARLGALFKGGEEKNCEKVGYVN